MGDPRRRSRRAVAPRRAAAALLGLVELALWITAAACLGYATWSWTEARLFQVLERREVAVWSSQPGAPPSVEGDPVEMPRPAPPPVGEPVARLVIPRLGVDVVVAEGATGAVLRRAAGRIPGSALPGEGGNVAIAAHRDSFFRPLEGIQPGDLVVLESETGVRRYRVEWARDVPPTAVDTVGPTGYSAVTLVTCFPFRYVGNAPRRYVVRAREMGDDEKNGSATTDRRS